jgi:hypothetical protein
MGRNARLTIGDFLRDVAYETVRGVVVEDSQVASEIARLDLPVRSIDGPLQPPPARPIDNARFPKLEGANGYDRTTALKLATLRTDLDAFSELEIDALRTHGRTLVDVNLRRFEPTWIDRGRDKGPIEAPRALTPAQLEELDKGREHRLGELFLRFWRT